MQEDSRYQGVAIASQTQKNCGQRIPRPDKDVMNKVNCIRPVLQFGDKVAEGGKKKFSRPQIATQIYSGPDWLPLRLTATFGFACT
jgi:hypothetical protein